jgi:hypothetical protein
MHVKKHRRSLSVHTHAVDFRPALLLHACKSGVFGSSDERPLYPQKRKQVRAPEGPPDRDRKSTATFRSPPGHV